MVCEVIHLQCVTKSIYLVAGVCHMLYFRLSPSIYDEQIHLNISFLAKGYIRIHVLDFEGRAEMPDRTAFSNLPLTVSPRSVCNRTHG